MPSHDEFEIDIISALSDQLVASFEKLEPGPLSETELSQLHAGQGVYQLFHNGSLVYVGKAGNLLVRLSEHREKITGRRNILIEEMTFKCLYVHKNWAALAPEASLINHYRMCGTGECGWNGISFGPHDPGRDRETTNKPPDGFDARYPIKEYWPCEWIDAGEHRGKDLLRSFKAHLPYLLRYETTGLLSKGHADYNETAITVPQSGMPARELLKLIAQHLPGWQATIFPSHMILYKEQRPYRHGEIIWPEQNSAS